jgi:large subunit ribosomal protein L10
MVKQYKIDKVKEMKVFFDDNKDYIFTDYKGLSVEKFTNLRKALKKYNAKATVIKNNYVRIIAEDKKIPNVDKFTTGPTAIVFSKDDTNEVVKILFDFTKTSSLKVKGGYADGVLMDDVAIESFSKLPGKKQMIAMVMATMNAPLQNFVYACNDAIGRFVRVVNAIAEKDKPAS